MPMKAEHVTGAKKESGKGAIAPIRSTESTADMEETPRAT